MYNDLSATPARPATRRDMREARVSKKGRATQTTRPKLAILTDVVVLSSRERVVCRYNEGLGWAVLGFGNGEAG